MPDVTEQQRAAWRHHAEQQQRATWQCDDDRDLLTSNPVSNDEQEQVTNAPTPTPASPERWTPSVQQAVEQDIDLAPVHQQPQAEMVRETCVSLVKPSIHEVWGRVRTEVPISLNERRIWIEPTYLLRIDQGSATVCAPNIFVRNRLATHYHDQLAATLSTIVGRPLRVEVVTESSAVGRRL